MQSNINRQIVSTYLESHYFSWPLWNSGPSLRNLLSGKTGSHILKNTLSSMEARSGQN